MIKEELLNALSNMTGDDPEVEHEAADILLLDYIGDQEIADAFLKLIRWYA